MMMVPREGGGDPIHGVQCVHHPGCFVFSVAVSFRCNRFVFGLPNSGNAR